MTTERSGPRPAEADIARNLADLLNRAHGRDLTPDEARVVAIDANRPVRQGEMPEESADPPERGQEPYEPADAVRGTGQDAYDVFDPGGVRWRL
jgi:hypothetical protein